MNGCSDSDASVSLKTVIDVLKKYNISVTVQKGLTQINENDISEVLILTNPVHRNMIHHLARKCNIPIHYFYHPEVLDQPHDKNVSPTTQ